MNESSIPTPRQLRVRARIRTTLRHYGPLTVTQLTRYIRPYDPEGWRDELEAMIKEGSVIREPHTKPTKNGHNTVLVHRLVS